MKRSEQCELAAFVLVLGAISVYLWSFVEQISERQQRTAHAVLDLQESVRFHAEEAWKARSENVRRKRKR